MLASAVGLAFAMSCGTGIESPREHPSQVHDYHVSLMADSATHYVLCPQGQLYCFERVVDTARDSLTVYVDLESTLASAWVPGGPFFNLAISLPVKGTATVPLRDSLDVMAASYLVPGGAGCVTLWLWGVSSNGVIAGNFRAQLDCHGLARWGRFTARE